MVPPAADRPLFSIGVTTYRRPELLRETLTSIREQTVGDFEVIVGNDDPDSILSAESLGVDDPRFRFVNHPANLGEIANMNSLLGVSRGRYFTWLADDDLYAPDFLQSVQEALVASGLPPCVFTAYTADRQEFYRTSAATRTVELSGQEFLAAFLERTVVKVLGCCGVFDTTYLRSIGGMTQLGEGFSPYSDVLLGIQCGELDRIVYLDRPLILYRFHEGSISANSDDVRAYRTAQQQLCAAYVSLYEARLPRKSFDSNLFVLLRDHCVGYFYSVVRRAGSVSAGELFGFLTFIAAYARRLGHDRWRFGWIAGKETARLLIWLIRRRLGGASGRVPRAA